MWEWLDDLIFEHPWKLVAAASAAASAAAFVLGTLAVVSEQSWREYVAAHHCREVSRYPRPPMYVLSGKVLVPIQQPDSVLWECDGGETIQR